MSEVTFDALAVSGGAVKTSRKKLNRAGESTNILITVTSADHKSKLVYTVTVNRTKEEESYVPKRTGTKPHVKGREKPKSGKFPHETEGHEPIHTDTPLHGEARTLYVTGNQMSAYLIGMFSTLGCISLGAFLMWMKKQIDTKKK